MFLVDEGSGDEDDGEDDGFGVELEKAVELLALGRFGCDVVGGEPVFVEPDVEEKDAEEAGEVEDVFFDGNGGAEGGGFDSEGCGLVGEGEEVAGEKEVQAGADGKEEADGPEKTILLDFDCFLGMNHSGITRNGMMKRRRLTV